MFLCPLYLTIIWRISLFVINVLLSQFIVKGIRLSVLYLLIINLPLFKVPPAFIIL